MKKGHQILSINKKILQNRKTEQYFKQFKKVFIKKIQTYITHCFIFHLWFTTVYKIVLRYCSYNIYKSSKYQNIDKVREHNMKPVVRILQSSTQRMPFTLSRSILQKKLTKKKSDIYVSFKWHVNCIHKITESLETKELLQDVFLFFFERDTNILVL